MEKLIYEHLIPETKRKEFTDAVRRIARKLGINPDWIMAAMFVETGGTFSAAIQNPTTKATGLIQFMPSTARGLGTTIEQLAAMSEVEQMEYVYKYLYPYRRKIKSFVDLYLSIFFPAAMDKGHDFIVQTSRLSAELIARHNPLFDLNKDRQITVSEIETSLLSHINPEYHDRLKKKV